MLSILALFTGLSMYQVVQKKFNLCVVVICNCFISLVNIVLLKMFFLLQWWYRSACIAPNHVTIASLRFDGKYLKCIDCIETFSIFIHNYF